MCGILGWAASAGSVDKGRFSTALDLLTHRGPDAAGTFFAGPVALGHRRLSIIDLSTAGHQPMFSADRQSVLVFNGEIYNYLELRDELRRAGVSFTTQSDSEVLLAVIEHWGVDGLAKLNGMWAFAIWDARAQTLLICRDRFGKKPLYFVHDTNGFAFASEPKALLSLIPQHKRVNAQSLRRFLAEGVLCDDGESFYESVRSLPAAHYAFYDLASAKLRIQRYWDYPQHQAPASGNIAPADINALIEQFEALLLDAVRVRLRSDVPLGISLSGGLDSTAVLAAACAQSSNRPACLTSTYGSADSGELAWAIKAAAPFGITPISVDADSNSAVDVLRKVAWHMDGPTYSPAVYPLYCLMQSVRKRGIRVMLEGQGADELLGGYVQHAAHEMLRRGRRVSQLPALASQLRTLGQTFGGKALVLYMARSLMPALTNPYRRMCGAASVLSTPYQFGSNGMNADRFNGNGLGAATIQQRASLQHTSELEPLNRHLLNDHSQAILPALLHYGDAVSMAHGVESRQPFLDYRLVEFALPLAAGIKLRGGESKWPLRQFLRRHSSQVIADRIDKKGYPTPINQWMTEHNGALLRDTLLAADARLLQWVDRDKLTRLVNIFLGGSTGIGNHLFRLLSTELWLQECQL